MVWTLLKYGYAFFVPIYSSTAFEYTSSFSSFSHIVNEFEKAQIKWKFLLREPPMRSQPRAEQGPKTFHGIDMHFMKSILILISGIFAFAMANHLMLIAPFFQSSINVIFVGINERVRRDGLFDNGLNSLLRLCCMNRLKLIVPYCLMLRR